MSRGIKDLRELICVSRLTVHHSDEEFPPSDDEVLLGRLSRLSFGIDTQSLSDDDSRRGSAGSSRSRDLMTPDRFTPDSGVAINGNARDDEDSTTPPMTEQSFVPVPPRQPSGDTRPTKARTKRRRKKKPHAEVMGPLHELPKAAPLPPVRGNSMESRASSSSSDGISSRAEMISEARHSAHEANNEPDGNFDDILTYLDATQISEFLLYANENVADLATWCHSGENFVHFGHFWLSDFPDMQKQEIIHLEYTILLEQLQFAFAAGRDQGKVKHRDIQRYMGAVFREYPSRLLSSKGAFLFLDYLDVLSSERTGEYKKVLSNVKCSTKIKQNAQWTLAVRSFALVNVWVAIVNFYRKLSQNTAKSLTDSSVSLAAIAKTDPHHMRMYQAIRNGYIDVVNYLLRTGKVHPQARDGHERTLVFTAVMHDQPKLLKFLLSKHVKPRPDVNLPADTGNTPLHAAANNGNAELVRILLQVPWLKVNATNPQCDHATPLHLAAMHGHTGVVELLLENKASCKMMMGDLEIETIAKDFGHDDIVELLKKYS